MILKIDREKRLILLQWLRQGYIDTLDLPDAYKDSSLFYEYLAATSVKGETTTDNPPLE